jgi:multidrug transporter EmrE-like cation transporter
MNGLAIDAGLVTREFIKSTRRMHWLFLIVAIGGNVTANIALKKLAMSDTNLGGWSGVWSIVSSLWFWLACLGSITLLSGYLLSIRKIELSLAYASVTAGALILISILSVNFLGTTINFAKIAGIAAIVAGIALLALGD